MATLSMARRVLLVSLLGVAGCASRGGPGVHPLLVTSVKTAHHGACPAASRRVFGMRATVLFSQPIPYRLYHCGSHTEAELLQTGCGTREIGKNAVFITLDRTRSVTFVQDGILFNARVQTFGEAWNDALGRAIMFFDGRGFPHPRLPPGAPRIVYRGPPRYGLFGITGDPLGIARGECPSETRSGSVPYTRQ
jgi:hypothetical protein